MKVHLLLITLIIASVNLSCNKQTDEDIEGKWHLTNKSGGFAGVNENFERDDITWTFNGTTLTVVNNTSTQSGDYFDNGTYSFTTITINGEEVLRVNGDEIGSYSVDKNNLSISERYVDGFYYQMEK